MTVIETVFDWPGLRETALAHVKGKAAGPPPMHKLAGDTEVMGAAVEAPVMNMLSDSVILPAKGEALVFAIVIENVQLPPAVQVPGPVFLTVSSEPD